MKQVLMACKINAKTVVCQKKGIWIPNNWRYHYVWNKQQRSEQVK